MTFFVHFIFALPMMVHFKGILTQAFVAPIINKYHHSQHSVILARKTVPLGSTLLGISSTSTRAGISPNFPTTVPDSKFVKDLPEPLDSVAVTNRYFLLRHGQSTANVAEIISSDRHALAYSEKHGLTFTGQIQGRRAASDLVATLTRQQQQQPQQHSSNVPRLLIFVSSPFARAKQTAEACMEELQSRPDLMSQLNDDELQLQLDPILYLHPALVERSFGRLDGEAIYTYAYVWPLDKHNVTHTAFDVESVAAVCHRIRGLIQDLESTWSYANIVLVSHADVLQIAQLYAAGVPNVGDFSSYRFANGEVRPMLVQDTSALPNPLPLQPPQRGTRM